MQKATKTQSYKVDIKKPELINCYVNEWVLEWCKKYHPEIFQKAKDYVTRVLKEQNEN